MFRTSGMLTASVFIALTALSSSALLAQEIPAAEMIMSIERELRFDQAVPEQNIDIDSKNGIVTLTGTVNDLLSKERAARIAETVKGVRAVNNRIDVVPVMDHMPWQLRQSVQAALFADAATESFEVTARVPSEGKVVLEGQTESWQERALAAKVAKGVAGVKALQNNIKVAKTEQRADREIEQDIEAALRWNVLVDSAMINVEVEDAKVKLSGTVGSAAEKRQASLDAWVSGVRSVDSEAIKVAEWARDPNLRKDKYSDKPDVEVKAAVRDALRYDPRVAVDDINVNVRDGFVTLQGKVSNLKAKQVAERDARNTVGVIGVSNLIKVRTEQPRSDALIAAEIRAALAGQAHIETDQIEVRVIDGTAHLDGRVDTVFKKASAEDVAARVAGVIHVQNDIEIGTPQPMVYNPYVDEWEIYNSPWYAVDRITPRKRDHEIRADINDELFWSPFVDADDVKVQVDAGIVTLKGQVESWREFDAATENALEGGAVRVVNKLEVD